MSKKYEVPVIFDESAWQRLNTGVRPTDFPDPDDTGAGLVPLSRKPVPNPDPPYVPNKWGEH
jgi:hypothetical protein